MIHGKNAQKTRRREEVVNTYLAEVIGELGQSAEAEVIKSGAAGREMPDVMLSFRGLRVVFECKFESSQAEANAEKQAYQRVTSGLAHIGVAVVYPKELRVISQSKLADGVKAANLKFSVFAEGEEKTLLPIESGSATWHSGTPSDILDLLRRAQNNLASEDYVEKIAADLRGAINRSADQWRLSRGDCDRLSEKLGYGAPKNEKERDKAMRHQSVTQIAALIFANAFIFQERLAAIRKDIAPLRSFKGAASLSDKSAEMWKKIRVEINYVPIFRLAEDALSCLSASPHTEAALRDLVSAAGDVCSKAMVGHDLMGRIYHLLLPGKMAKYLGNYYTSNAAAALLTKLAFSSNSWSRTVNFGDAKALQKFQVADLACGTGTLLMASAQAMTDSYVRARARAGQKNNAANLGKLHRVLMEDTLYGFDVLSSTVHLSASALAMLASQTSVAHMNLYMMPLCMENTKARLGSIDFLREQQVPIQSDFAGESASSVHVSGSGTREIVAKLPELDLCVMNPPFVRSANPSKLFGTLPEKQRKQMQDALKKEVKHIQASATAGLGSVFVAVADKRLKPGGRLAFVLPQALASGKAWGETRKLLAEKYDLEFVVSSHDPQRPNFSENTKLSEILFVARKRATVNGARNQTVFINLWQNPRSFHSALEIARMIEKNKAAELDGVGSGALRVLAGKVGEMVRLPFSCGENPWIGSLFAQTVLLRVFLNLTQGRLVMPPQKESHIPICRIADFGEIGPDIRDIHDAFECSNLGDEAPIYKSFWNHESDRDFQMEQKYNQILTPRAKPAPGRPRRNPDTLWARAGDILIPERIGSIKHRLLAIRLETPVLSNTWWELRSGISSERKKALVLWLNSTLGILMFYGARTINNINWVNIKKPMLLSLPVLDVRKMSASQLRRLSRIYDDLRRESLQPLSGVASDLTRHKIDGALQEALQIPDLALLREIIAREPGISGRVIG